MTPERLVRPVTGVGKQATPRTDVISSCRNAEPVERGDTLPECVRQRSQRKEL